MKRRYVGTTLAVGALILAGCSSAGEDAPTGGSDEAEEGAQAQEPEEEPADNDDGDDDDGDAGEAMVNVSLDGDGVDFDYMFCEPSPGNEGRMRLFAEFGDEELTVDAADDGVDITFEPADGSTYYNREANGIDFEDGTAQGEVEISDADDDVITVMLDLDC